MAGEEAYYNPIIRSMVETAQLQQHAQQLQQQKEFQTAGIRNRQRLADLHEKQIEQQHQQYLNTLKNVHIPQVQAALEAHKIANIVFFQAENGIRDQSRRDVHPLRLDSVRRLAGPGPG